MPCVYCGANDSQVGFSCPHSPTTHHVIDDPKKCRFCGANETQVGFSCNKSPIGTHVLGNGANKCVFVAPVLIK